MQDFTWKIAYEIGDAKIDAQHQRLFDLANEIVHADDEAQLTFATMKLYQYVRVHFKHEEAVMKELGYPERDRHIEQHEQLLERLNGLSQEIAAGHWHAEGLHEFMTDWLLGHIVEEDSRLAACINGQLAMPRATRTG